MLLRSFPSDCKCIHCISSFHSFLILCDVRFLGPDFYVFDDPFQALSAFFFVLSQAPFERPDVPSWATLALLVAPLRPYLSHLLTLFSPLLLQSLILFRARSTSFVVLFRSPFASIVDSFIGSERRMRDVRYHHVCTQISLGRVLEECQCFQCRRSCLSEDVSSIKRSITFRESARSVRQHCDSDANSTRSRSLQ